MIGHHAVYAFVFHRLLCIDGIENRSQHLSLRCKNLRHRCTNFGRLGKAAAAVAIDKVPIVWGVEIGTDWVEHFHKFLGTEMWCLDFQILLVPTVLVVGKPAMVQLIRSASRAG